MLCMSGSLLANGHCGKDSGDYVFLLVVGCYGFYILPLVPLAHQAVESRDYFFMDLWWLMARGQAAQQEVVALIGTRTRGSPLFA